MKDYYELLSKKEIMNSLKTSLAGISKNEAKKRLEKYGLNELPKEKNKSILKMFLSSINDPIIWVLIFAAIISFIVSEIIDGIAIIIIILIDAIVSTIQEYSANKNSEALKNLITVKTKVIRENQYFEIDSNTLVPGDLVAVEPGTKIPADLRLIKATNIMVDESILTGESVGVLKDDTINKNKPNYNILFGGTSVLTGYGLAVVLSTGINTEIGKIAQKVTDSKESKSPLTIRMEKFSKQITLIIIATSLIIGAILITKDNHIFDIFLSVVALSVSAMPEGLPLALTMALTIGSSRMSKRNVIVKKLNSVESLGSCTVIATDKTGTLTVNEQTAKIIVMANGDKYKIDGSGYNPDGKVEPLNKAKISEAEYISKLGYINNDSIFEYDIDSWKKIGDSIDIAFKVLAHKLKTNKDDFIELVKIPYESENKYSALFYQDKNDIKCTAKGSIEKILEFCSYSYDNDKRIKIDKKNVIKQNDELASSGYRVIAICDGTLDKKHKYNEEDIKNLTFIGLIGFIDPVRKEAISAIRKCKLAGIKVIMITGDHALTALTIGKELRIADTLSDVITGEELEKYIDDNNNFDELIKNKKIFARVTPIEKLKIVESLQRREEFVAVTGDGVNDAPAIKIANIGISMGSGTDVAKETANMIIIDDNFASIVSGIEEGRNAYSNIRKISILLLSCGLAEVLFFLLSIIFDMELPLVAIQLLWLNLVTDGLQDMALSFEKETDTIMHQKPRSTKEGLFEKNLIIQILISGLFMGVIVFIVWVFLIKVFKMDIGLARGYILALMVFMQNLHVLNCRSEEKSIFENTLSSNRYVVLAIGLSIILQIVVMEVPLFSKFLQTASVPYLHMILLLLSALPILFVMELYKYIKKNKARNML